MLFINMTKIAVFLKFYIFNLLKMFKRSNFR
jgi:hypothetical protein